MGVFKISKMVDFCAGNNDKRALKLCVFLLLFSTALVPVLSFFFYGTSKLKCKQKGFKPNLISYINVTFC